MMHRSLKNVEPHHHQALWSPIPRSALTLKFKMNMLRETLLIRNNATYSKCTMRCGQKGQVSCRGPRERVGPWIGSSLGLLYGSESLSDYFVLGPTKAVHGPGRVCNTCLFSPGGFLVGLPENQQWTRGIRYYFTALYVIVTYTGFAEHCCLAAVHCNPGHWCLWGYYLGPKLHQVGQVLDRLGHQGECPDGCGGGRVCKQSTTPIHWTNTLLLSSSYSLYLTHIHVYE